MELPSAGVAAANALALCEENGEIYCKICPTNSRFRDWKNHIFDSTHLKALVQFNLIFEKTADKVHCVLCDGNFEWREMKMHARVHMIKPWHKSENEYDKYEIFFENRIIEWNNMFRCCLCDATFSDWNIVFVHTTDSTHRSLCEGASPRIYEFSDDAVSRQLLVTECITADGENTLECRICRVKVVVDSVVTHAKGLMHRRNKFKFRLELNEREVNETAVETIREHVPFVAPTKAVETIREDVPFVEPTKAVEADSSTNKRANDRESLSLLYVERRDEIDSYCVICNCTMFHHSVKNHVKDKDHVDAEKEYACGAITRSNGNEYRCTICERQLNSDVCVRSHVTGSKHLKSMNAWIRRRLERKSMNDKEAERTKLVDEEFSKLDVDKSLANGFYRCKSCNVELNSLQTVYEHVRGRKHMNSLMKKTMQTLAGKINGVESSDKVTELRRDRSTDNDRRCSLAERLERCRGNISHESDAMTPSLAKVRPHNEGKRILNSC